MAPIVVSELSADEREALRLKGIAEREARHKANRVKNNDRSARWARNNRDRRRKIEVRWRKANPEKVRSQKRKSAYGISTVEWGAIFTAQGRVCGNCGANDPGWYRGWHTDHCHETGEVRGILCHKCNHILGNARDSPEILQRAIEYLKNPPARKVLKCDDASDLPPTLRSRGSRQLSTD